GLTAKRAHRRDGGPARAERDGEALAKAMAARATTFVAPAPEGWRRALNGQVVAIFPKLSARADRITIESAVLDEARYVREAMRPYGVEPGVVVVGVEPTDAEISRACEQSASSDATILFLYDAHLYPSNRRLLDVLQERVRPLGVVLMRD